ncbi:uncharacterized protein LOC141849853 isoform X2 [Brevipalpus obovatus]|uniref:uncharacterized protein LOC141849853 isoform X2 n=1 Tax=Brevipalpus obovatus TaxID=246614 RepID=UPI003D9F100E
MLCLIFVYLSLCMFHHKSYGSENFMRLIRSSSLKHPEKADCRCSQLSASALFLYSHGRNSIPGKSRLTKEDCFRLCSKPHKILDKERILYSREPAEKRTITRKSRKQIISEYHSMYGKPFGKPRSLEKPVSSEDMNIDRDGEPSNFLEISDSRGSQGINKSVPQRDHLSSIKAMLETGFSSQLINIDAWNSSIDGNKSLSPIHSNSMGVSKATSHPNISGESLPSDDREVSWNSSASRETRAKNFRRISSHENNREKLILSALIPLKLPQNPTIQRYFKDGELISYSSLSTNKLTSDSQKSLLEFIVSRRMNLFSTRSQGLRIKNGGSMDLSRSYPRRIKKSIKSEDSEIGDDGSNDHHQLKQTVQSLTNVKESHNTEEAVTHTHHEHPHHEQPHHERVHHEQSHHEQSHHDQAHHDQTHHEQSHQDQAHHETAYHEQPRHEQPNHEHQTHSKSDISDFDTTIAHNSLVASESWSSNAPHSDKMLHGQNSEVSTQVENLELEQSKISNDPVSSSLAIHTKSSSDHSSSADEASDKHTLSALHHSNDHDEHHHSTSSGEEVNPFSHSQSPSHLKISEPTSSHENHEKVVKNDHHLKSSDGSHYQGEETGTKSLHIIERLSSHSSANSDLIERGIIHSSSSKQPEGNKSRQKEKPRDSRGPKNSRFQFRELIRHHGRIMKRKSNSTRTTRSSHRSRFFNKSRSILSNKNSPLNTTKSSTVLVTSRALSPTSTSTPSPTSSLTSSTISNPISSSFSVTPRALSTGMTSGLTLSTASSTTPSPTSSPVPSTSHSIILSPTSIPSMIPNTSPISSTNAVTSTETTLGSSKILTSSMTLTSSLTSGATPSSIFGSISGSNTSAASNSSSSTVLSNAPNATSSPTSSQISNNNPISPLSLGSSPAPNATPSATPSMTSETNASKPNRLFLVTYKALNTNMTSDLLPNTNLSPGSSMSPLSGEDGNTHSLVLLSSLTSQNENLKTIPSIDMTPDFSTVNASNLVTLENNGSIVLFKSSLPPQIDGSNMNSISDIPTRLSSSEGQLDRGTDADSVMSLENDMPKKYPPSISEGHGSSEKIIIDSITNFNSEKTELTSPEMSIHTESFSTSSDFLKTPIDELHPSEHSVDSPIISSEKVSDREESSDKMISSKSPMNEFDNQTTIINSFTNEISSASIDSISVFDSSIVSQPTDNIPSVAPSYSTLESKVSQSTTSMHPPSTSHISSIMSSAARRKILFSTVANTSVSSGTPELIKHQSAKLDSPSSGHNKHSPTSSKSIWTEHAKSTYSPKEFNDISPDRSYTDSSVSVPNFSEKKITDLQIDIHSKVSQIEFDDQTTQSGHFSTSASSSMAHLNPSENELTVENDHTTTAHIAELAEQGSSSVDSVPTESYNHDTSTRLILTDSQTTSSAADRESALISNEHSETKPSHSLHSRADSATDHPITSDKLSSHSKISESSTQSADTSSDLSTHETTGAGGRRKISHDLMKTSPSGELSHHNDSEDSGSDRGSIHNRFTNSDSYHDLEPSTLDVTSNDNDNDAHSRMPFHMIETVSSSESEPVTLIPLLSHTEEKSSYSGIAVVSEKIHDDSVSTTLDSEYSDSTKVGHRIKVKFPKLSDPPRRTKKTRATHASSPIISTSNNLVPSNSDLEKFEFGKVKNTFAMKHPTAQPDSLKTPHIQHVSMQTMPVVGNQISPGIEAGKFDSNKAKNVQGINSPKYLPDSLKTSDFPSTPLLAMPSFSNPPPPGSDHGKEKNILGTKLPKVSPDSLKGLDGPYVSMPTIPSSNNPLPSSGSPESSEDKNSFGKKQSHLHPDSVTWPHVAQTKLFSNGTAKNGNPLVSTPMLPPATDLVHSSNGQGKFESISEENTGGMKFSQVSPDSVSKPNVPLVSMPQFNNPISQNKNMGKSDPSKQESSGGISMPDILPESMPTMPPWKNPFSQKTSPGKGDADEEKYISGMTMPDILPKSVPSLPMMNNFISSSSSMDNPDSGKEKNNLEMTMPTLPTFNNPLSSSNDIDKSDFSEEKNSGGMKIPHVLPDSVTMPDIVPDSMPTLPTFNNPLSPGRWTMTMPSLATFTNPLSMSNNLHKSNSDKQYINGGMTMPSINSESMSARPSRKNPISPHNYIPEKFDPKHFGNVATTPRKDVLSKMPHVNLPTRAFSDVINVPTSHAYSLSYNGNELADFSSIPQVSSDQPTRSIPKIASKGFQGPIQSPGKIVPVSISNSVNLNTNSDHNLNDKNFPSSYPSFLPSMMSLSSKGSHPSSLGLGVTVSNQYHSTVKPRNHISQIPISTMLSNIESTTSAHSENQNSSPVNQSKFDQQITQVMGQLDRGQSIAAITSGHNRPVGHGSLSQTVPSNNSPRANTEIPNPITSRFKLASLDDHGIHSSVLTSQMVPKERIHSFIEADNPHTSSTIHDVHPSSIHNSPLKEPILKEAEYDPLISASRRPISSREETELSDTESDLISMDFHPSIHQSTPTTAQESTRTSKDTGLRTSDPLD